MSLLECTDVQVHFGGVRAVDGVTLTLEHGRIYGLVGPNGSGKSTLINAISGATALTAGSVTVGGTRIDGQAPSAILRHGIARTYQSIRLIPTLSVIENVALGADALSRPLGSLDVALRPIAARRGERARLEVAREMLSLVGVTADPRSNPRSLPYGTQRRIEVARALAASPQILLLDEPVAGMTDSEKDEIAAVMHIVKSRGTTQLLVEHDLRVVTQNSDHLFVMDFGKIIAEGEPQATAAAPNVREAYLGRK